MKYIIKNEKELLSLAYSFITYGIIFRYIADYYDATCSKEEEFYKYFIIESDLETIMEEFGLIINIPDQIGSEEYVEQHDNWELKSVDDFKVDTDIIDYKYPVIVSSKYVSSRDGEEVFIEIYNLSDIEYLFNNSEKSKYELLAKSIKESKDKFMKKYRHNNEL